MRNASLAFLCGTDLDAYPAGGLTAFHRGSPVMRYAYGKIAKWTGLDHTVLLDRDRARSEAGERAGRVALATAMLGIHEVLAVHNIRPGVLGGVGIGSMVAACLAGALPREELINVLLAGAGPADTDPAGALALAFLPTGHDPDWYRGAESAGVVSGGSLGPDSSGAYRVVLLTGERHALERLAAEAPRGAIRISAHGRVTVHSPFALDAQARMRQRTAQLPFTDPLLPLCSPVGRGTLRTADEVRDMFCRTVAHPVDLGSMASEMRSHGVRLGLVLGPSLPKNLLTFPFPVVHVESPDGVAEAVSAITEFAVQMPPVEQRSPAWA